MDIDLFAAWFCLIVCAVPYVFLCRLIWHAGTWFKRQVKPRLEYRQEDYK